MSHTLTTALDFAVALFPGHALLPKLSQGKCAASLRTERDCDLSPSRRLLRHMVSVATL